MAYIKIEVIHEGTSYTVTESARWSWEAPDGQGVDAAAGLFQGGTGTSETVSQVITRAFERVNDVAEKLGIGDERESDAF